MKKLLTLIIAIFLLIIGAIMFTNLGNESTTAPAPSGKLIVTTSFYPLYFFASEIGGDKAEVKNITPAGAEPHDYDPTTQDFARIESSKLLILNGNVEGWGSKIKNNLKGKNVTIITASDGLLTQNLREDGETTKDPHIWLDPVLAKQEAQKILSGYIEVDPKNKQYYQSHAQILMNKLDALDREFKQGLQNCQEKDLITSHAAFGYLASRYKLNQVPVAGLSPDEEPSAKQLAKVVDFAKQNNVKYIFFESLVSPKLADTIASEVGAQTLVLDPLEGVSDNDLSAGKDYFTLMRDNLTHLQKALVCK